MKEPRVSDIPSIRGTLDQIQSLAAVKPVYCLLRPVLRAFGVDTRSIDKSLEQLIELRKEVEELADILDRFNEAFASRGWIAYESMNLQMARTAIAKAKTEGLDAAEAYLVDCYSPEEVGRQLRRMNAVQAFRPRMRLAEKALQDYSEGRYHASVPVVLALMDGLVNELHESHRGFFSDGTDLTAWDSIAAHETGLNELVAVLRKGRRKTTVEAITLPYRNGIMHGMDLGYDNRLVAAKTWAALFAVREWALKAERGEIAPPAQEAKPTWSDMVLAVLDNVAEQKRMREWAPRKITIGTDVPPSGDSDLYSPGSPERTLAEYLQWWKQRNYGRMAQCLSAMSGYSPKKAPAVVREVFGNKTLVLFRLLEIRDEAPAITVIDTELVYEESGVEKSAVCPFRLINEDSRGRSRIRGAQGTCWKLIIWRVQ